MQSSVTRRLFQNTLKISSRAVQSNIQYAVLAQPLVQQAAPSMNLTSTLQRGFSEQGNFDKVTSYESLISRISNASHVNDLLEIMSQNLNLYKNEHIVLTLRVLARLIRSSNFQQADSLLNDERYRALTEKAQENLEQFNEYEILDFLFWLRRFKLSRLPVNISDASLNKLYARVKEFVKSKSFNFRNLVNLYYDLSALNRNTEDIAAEILNELKADSKLLTPFTIVQIIQAAANKKAAASPKEIAVVDFVQRALGDMLQEFDSDQKCMVFKHLASLEMHMHPPRYRVPNVLFNLRNNLKEILDQLSEVGVVNIIDAYNELPKEFPSDLLDEIREMVIVTVQHNSENIKSFFLVDFLERILNLPRSRRTQQDKITIIYEEISKRLLEDDYLGKPKVLERLIDIYDKAGIEYDQLVEKIYQRALNYKGLFYSRSVLLSLNNKGKDITPILDRLTEEEALKKINNAQRLQLSSILSAVESTKYDSIRENLLNQIASDKNDPARLINILSENFRSTKVEEQMTQAVEGLKAQKGQISDLLFYKNMFLSVQNRNLRNLWTAWAKETSANLEKQELSRICDALLSLERVNNEQMILFNNILTQAKAENFPLKKLISTLRDNREFISQVSRFEGRLDRLLGKISSVMEVQKEELRLPIIFGFVKRLENMGVRSAHISQIAKKAYELGRRSESGSPTFLDVLYSSYLIDQGHLNQTQAKEIYGSGKKFLEDPQLNSKFYTYILQNSSQAILEEDETINEINQKLDVLQKKFSEAGGKAMLTTLATILAYPPQFLEPNKDLYVKSLKSYINYATPNLYLNLINSIPQSYTRTRYDFYLPFLRELIINYHNFNLKFPPTDTIKILKKFAELKTRNPTIYNHILADIGRVFNSFRVEDLVEITKAFASVNIKQNDLFDKILAKIGSNPYNFSTYGNTLITSLFRVGFNSAQAKATFSDLLTKLTPKKASIKLALANYIPILDLPNEAEHLEKLLADLPENSGRFSLKALCLLHEYLRVQYKNKPELAAAVKKLIPGFEEIRQHTFKESNAVKKSREIICNYLDAMKVQYQADFSVDGFSIDLYLPEQKNLVKIFLSSDVNFDKLSLSGRSLLTKKIYQSFDGYKSTFINMSEFNSIPEPMNKVNHLVSIGIQDNNKEGLYDFSTIDPSSKEKEIAEEAERDDESEINDEQEALSEEEDAQEKKH